MDEINNQIDPVLDNNGDNVNDNNDIEEDSDDEDDGYYLLDKINFHHLKQNDVSMTVVNVDLNCDGHGGESYFNGIDWKVDGDCIADNRHIKRLNIEFSGRCLGRHCGEKYILGEQGHNLPTKQQLQHFFSCICQNRSIIQINIQSIYIDEFGGGLLEGLAGHLSLERLQIEYGRLRGVVCTALGHEKSKLKDLCLPNCEIHDEGLVALCNGLVGNSTLKKLCLSGNDAITSVGWRALSTVLQHPNCKLVALDLNNNGINDDSANVLNSALWGLSSLKTLDLGWRQCACQSLFNQLSLSSIENLNLECNLINDSELVALASINTLRSLGLKGVRRSTTPAGWSSFFVSLQRNGIQLVKLNISLTSIGDVGLAALGQLLNTMSTLRTLMMINIFTGHSFDNLTPHGWQTFFTSLQETNSNLVNLFLGSNKIDNHGMELLMRRLVSNMISLKHLSLRYSDLVSPTGWQALTGYLQSPNFALETLDLEGNNINDDIVTAFTSALVHNKTLEQIHLYQEVDSDSDYDADVNNELITERGWEAMSTLLCNKSSILDTYISNHTLHKVGDNHEEMNLPDDLVSYLELNENKDKAEVARQKILQTHFSTEDNESSNMQEFLDMELEVMPTAIAWIGRTTQTGWSGTCASGSSLSLTYNLMRRVPDLLDLKTAQMKSSVGKRKHDAHLV